jgi:CDP-glucose 4,6-dehydratase
VESYTRSFFNSNNYTEHQKGVASVRAGNVIGGGDFSDDRIIPDIARALEFAETVGLRNPHSVRPWQHVLEPLGAYLLLAARMSEDPVRYSSAYNFGPNADDMLTVEELTKIFLTKFGQGSYKITTEEKQLHEAKLLLLDSSKAATLLGWKPQMNARQAIEMTAEWYADKDNDAHTKCLLQVKEYFGQF